MAELFEEQVNLGRALVGLHLEELVLKADLSDKPLAERASLVNGVLKGMLEKGRWQTALHSVYGKGIVGSLFDGDWKTFTGSVIEAAKKSDTDEVSDDIFELILKKWAPEDVYRLATESALPNKCAHPFIRAVKDKIPKELVEKAYVMFGGRALENKDFESAHYYFRESGNTQKLNELYDNIIKDATKEGIEFLIELAKRDESNNREPNLDAQRLSAVVQTLLKDKKLRKKIGFYKIESLYKLHKKQPFLGSKEEKELIDVVAPHWSGCEIGKDSDKKLDLAWALTHTADEPALAYRILKKAKHKGPDVLTAAINGLLSHKRRDGTEYNEHRLQLSLDDIDAEDLKAVLDRAPLDLKADIAEHLDNKVLILKLSREFYNKRTANNGYLEKAYHLGFIAGKARDEKYINKLRTELIEQELKKESTSYYFFGLNRKDVKGYTQAYNAVIGKDPESAYRLAKDINNEKLMQQAREAIVQKSPERAFSYFNSSTEDRQDHAGIALAISALAEKYSVSKETLQKALEPAIKQPDNF